MADEEQLSILRQGVEAWNAWRRAHPGILMSNLIQADLRGADLSGADLHDVDFTMADLRGADLRGADLSGADLSETNFRETNFSGAKLGEAKLGSADLTKTNFRKAYLRRADLTGATLHKANLSGVDLRGAILEFASLLKADLSGADLTRANLNGADLTKTDLSKARLDGTILAGLNLSKCKGIERCVHDGPSSIDYVTLQSSGQLPLAFLRGVGLPDNLIDYLPSLLDQPIQLYSCFISYSSKDEAFAQRLHADLQNKGVRCWFAPEDMKIGDRIGDTIDTAIRLRDKLLLILSETSVASAWVLKEVRTALEEEKQHGRAVLFPIRVDNAVMDTTEQWAHDIRRTRHIGDFSRWKEHDAYTKALERLLRDLRVETS
jgi:uncharacterized protein YjbI with pentapeptide repeats